MKYEFESSTCFSGGCFIVQAFFPFFFADVAFSGRKELRVSSNSGSVEAQLSVVFLVKNFVTIVLILIIRDAPYASDWT